MREVLVTTAAAVLSAAIVVLLVCLVKTMASGRDA